MMKVEGFSKMEVTPDYVTIPITIRETSKDFDESVKKLNAKTAILYKDLAKAGFEDDITITGYNVREDYSYKDGSKITNSYTRDLTVQIEFDYDQSKLVNTINILNNSAAEPSFKTIFSKKELDKVYDELRYEAVQDAINNARILADSAELTLNQIASVEYLNTTPNIYRASIDVVSFVPTSQTYTDKVIIEYTTSPK